MRAEDEQANACRKLVCDSKIHSGSDFRKGMLAIRQKLSSEGITNFESDERFKRLAECKMDDYYDENQCAALNNPEPAYQTHIASETSRPKTRAYEKSNR